MILRNNSYRQFVESHIMRPYQSMIMDDSKPATFKSTFCGYLPEIAIRNPLWADRVFDRISNIYDEIEGSLFPNSETGRFIVAQLKNRGVTISEKL